MTSEAVNRTVPVTNVMDMVNDGEIRGGLVASSRYREAQQKEQRPRNMRQK